MIEIFVSQSAEQGWPEVPAKMVSKKQIRPRRSDPLVAHSIANNVCEQRTVEALRGWTQTDEGHQDMQRCDLR